MITGTESEYQPIAIYKKDNPYLALTGELWVVFCEYLWENWPRYNGTALYFDNWNKSMLGCVIPLGCPRSVYKSYVEIRFLDS